MFTAHSVAVASTLRVFLSIVGLRVSDGTEQCVCVNHGLVAATKNQRALAFTFLKSQVKSTMIARNF